MFRRRALLVALPLSLLSLVVGPWTPAVAQVTVPTGPGGSDATGASASAGAVAISVSLASVGFGELDPGALSPPVALDIRNEGVAPASLALAATPLTDPATGTSIPAGRLAWALSAGGAGTPVGAGVAVPDLTLLPGTTSRIYLTLQVPSGAEQYVPEGDYAGTLTVTATEVGP